jgi:hypothetical protein
VLPTGLLLALPLLKAARAGKQVATCCRLPSTTEEVMAEVVMGRSSMEEVPLLDKPPAA